MSDYCCEAFEAHVGIQFFRKDFFGEISENFGLYSTGWGVLITTIEEWPTQGDGGWRWGHEFNFMPLQYCPFCGIKPGKLRVDND